MGVIVTNLPQRQGWAEQARWALLGALLCGGTAQAACPAAPLAVRDIEANTYYVDAHHSVIDPQRQARYRQSVQPIEDYLQRVSTFADAAVLQGDRAAATCALQWLQRWALDGALTGAMRNPQGGTQAEYVRKWTLAGLSLAYLKVRSEATPQQVQDIASWMQTLADRALAMFDSPKYQKNNHYYWVGLAVMGTGVATGSARHREAAQQVFFHAMRDIADDGSLPLEMQRATLALHYHHYALAPLALMARLARWQGQDWEAATGQRLALLRQRVLDGLENPDWFAQRTGYPQKTVTGTVRCWATLDTATRAVAPEGACHYKHFGGSTLALAQVLAPGTH